MSQDHAAASTASEAPRSDWQALREALALFRTDADAFSKRRLLLALALVAGAALLETLTPTALRLVVDALACGASRSRVC